MPPNTQHAPTVGKNFSHFGDSVDAFLVVDGHFHDVEMKLAALNRSS
jgi:hypothetical protein